MTLSRTNRDDIFALNIQEVLKGGREKDPVLLDLSRATSAALKTEVFQHILKHESAAAILFVGQKYNGRGDEYEVAAFLHVGAKWLALTKGSDSTTLEFDHLSAHMETTWAGATDMLIGATRYVLADKAAVFPVKAGVRWMDPVKVGSSRGAAVVTPVALDGDGRWSLSLMSGKGDRLFTFDRDSKLMKDTTKAMNLVSKSVAACWGDFNADGTLDLASFDGDGLTVFTREADGMFKAHPVVLPVAALKLCKALSVVDGGQKGRLALIISGGPAPFIVRDCFGAAPEAEPISDGGINGATLGEAGKSLVFDCDGDGVADVLSLFEKGSILYKGKGGGAFNAAVKSEVAMGPGAKSACLGDFDADGRLDVFTVSDEGGKLWQNGAGAFSECLQTSGDIGYISKPKGVDCAVCDINNDGKQDLMIAYGGEPGIQLFFNRGFRSFWHAHELDVQEQSLLEAAVDGVKSACIADFNGDGAQDMAVLLQDGDVWIFYRDVDDVVPLSAVVTMGKNQKYKGPVKVVGWDGEGMKHCLGAWNVVPGAADAFFGARDPGRIRIKWQLPGGSEQSSDVIVKDRSIRFVVE